MIYSNPENYLIDRIKISVFGKGNDQAGNKISGLIKKISQKILER